MNIGLGNGYQSILTTAGASQKRAKSKKWIGRPLLRNQYLRSVVHNSCLEGGTHYEAMPYYREQR